MEVEARDVMAYVYRRILRKGYDDSYPNIKEATERAQKIIVDGLAPDDPNVLPYLTRIVNPGDARESRIVPPMSKTCWEEVDDLAATAGIDYVTVGRRIILWDTHQPVGMLPEMRDEHFTEPIIVTEYGMLLANLFAVTNNNGLSGRVVATDPDGNPVPEKFYGRVEMLASAYGEAAASAEENLTPAQRQALVETLTEQAARNISGRWPTPLVARVPDNSTIDPTANVDINWLVPGVWIPLRATRTCRNISQLQKLDSVKVNVSDNGEERVQVVLSPAPLSGALDPDLDSALEAQ